jgi:hypothetical protein
MRTRAAYIRSLGTTGILLIAALMLLGVVGALVSFDRWPDDAVGETVPTVPVSPAPQRTLQVVRSRPVHKTPVAHLVKATASTAGLVKVVRVSEPAEVSTPVVATPGHVAPAAPAPTAASPQHQPAHPAHTHQAPAPADPAGDLDPETLRDVVDGLLAAVPVSPQPPRPGQPLEVDLAPVATITTPPLP